jgi:hypothetical protein
VNTYLPLEAAAAGKQDSCRFLGHPARSFWNANGPLGDPASCWQPLSRRLAQWPGQVPNQLRTYTDKAGVRPKLQAIPEPEKLIPLHGGCRRLKSFQMAQLVYDLTVRLCDRYLQKRSHTHDQMVLTPQQAPDLSAVLAAQRPALPGTDRPGEHKNQPVRPMNNRW